MGRIWAIFCMFDCDALTFSILGDIMIFERA